MTAEPNSKAGVWQLNKAFDGRLGVPATSMQCQQTIANFAPVLAPGGGSVMQGGPVIAIAPDRIGACDAREQLTTYAIKI
jgi:hypothetical protein